MKNMIKKIISVALITVVILNLIETKGGEKDKNRVSNVKEVTPQSFYSELKKFGKLFLYFYSEKCGHCSTFNPLFEEIAKISTDKKHGFGFVKIDGPKNEEFADTFKMGETPSLYFIEKAEGQLLKTKYEGRRSVRAMSRYLEKKHKYRPRELTEYKGFKELVKKAKRFVLFFGDKEKHGNILDRVVSSALDFNIENILWTKSEEFYEKYKVPKGSREVILHTNTNDVLDDGLRFDLPGLEKEGYRLTPKNIFHLMLVFSRNPVNKFTEATIRNVPLGESDLCIGVYGNEKSRYKDNMLKQMEETAIKYRKDCFWFVTHFGSREANSFTEPLGIKKSDLPAFVIFHPEPDDPDNSQKYLKKSVNKTLEEGVYLKWFENYRTGKLDKAIMSEDIPQNPIDNWGVYKLVGHTFKDIIVNKAAGKHVILNVCTDNIRCHNWEMRFGRAVKKLRKNEDLFFAKIDLRRNEFDYLNLGMTPTVGFIFDGINKFENLRIYNENNLTTSGLINFIQKQLFTINKNKKLIVEPMDDDKVNDEKDKHSPIRSKQEEADGQQQEDDGRDHTLEEKVGDLFGTKTGGEGSSTDSTADSGHGSDETPEKDAPNDEKMDLDGASAESEHTKEGL